MDGDLPVLQEFYPEDTSSNDLFFLDLEAEPPSSSLWRFDTAEGGDWELLQGLGERSTRHVMTRADLLVIEVMLHLAEGYRRRYQERVHPPVQRMLPGFDAA